MQVFFFFYAVLSKCAAAVKPQETLHPPNQAKCYTKAPPDRAVQEHGGGSSHTTEKPMKLPEVRDLGSVPTLLLATCAILKSSPVDAGS